MAVSGLSEQKALTLGARYEQNAIFAWTPAAWRILSCSDKRQVEVGWLLGEPSAQQGLDGTGLGSLFDSSSASSTDLSSLFDSSTLSTDLSSLLDGSSLATELTQLFDPSTAASDLSALLATGLPDLLTSI